MGWIPTTVFAAASSTTTITITITTAANIKRSNTTSFFSIDILSIVDVLRAISHSFPCHNNPVPRPSTFDYNTKPNKDFIIRLAIIYIYIYILPIKNLLLAVV
ncbi:hypothetical protein V1514DRAFT_326325, partial [Lipomyces japonicus]|uniref:uncharacterized protein n=1 Tax=Lipomyces japonicus TaxID=56871 RepID=UPI0034CFAAD8